MLWLWFCLFGCTYTHKEAQNLLWSVCLSHTGCYLLTFYLLATAFCCMYFKNLYFHVFNCWNMWCIQHGAKWKCELIRGQKSFFQKFSKNCWVKGLTCLKSINILQLFNCHFFKKITCYGNDCHCLSSSHQIGFLSKYLKKNLNYFIEILSIIEPFVCVHLYH